MLNEERRVRGLQRLTYNAVNNGIGQILPMVLGILTVPPLLRGLGSERFGLLTLAWTMVGVFALFDFGLGRAITQNVSTALAQGRREDVGEIVQTGLISILLFGILGGVVLWFGAVPLASKFKAGSLTQGEGVMAIRMVAIGLPTVTAMSGVRAFLESMGEFKVINIHRILIGLGTFLGPLIVLRWTPHVAIHVASLVAVRLFSLLFQYLHAHTLCPAISQGAKYQWARFMSLLRYGGWMTVSNLISPMMVYMDRFFIGSIIGLQAVTYYATPVDVLTRTLVIPNALTSALFPLVTEQWHTPEGDVRRLYRKSLKSIAFLVSPAALVALVFAPEILSLWMGPVFANHAQVVFRILILGVVANALSAVPYALLQAAGMPDITAKIHIVELPIYLITLYAFSRSWGLTGAAWAWSLRLLVDAILLFILWNRISRRRSCQISIPS